MALAPLAAPAAAQRVIIDVDADEPVQPLPQVLARQRAIAERVVVSLYCSYFGVKLDTAVPIPADEPCGACGDNSAYVDPSNERYVVCVACSHRVVSPFFLAERRRAIFKGAVPPVVGSCDGPNCEGADLYEYNAGASSDEENPVRTGLCLMCGVQRPLEEPMEDDPVSPALAVEEAEPLPSHVAFAPDEIEAPEEGFERAESPAPADEVSDAQPAEEKADQRAATPVQEAPEVTDAQPAEEPEERAQPAQEVPVAEEVKAAEEEAKPAKRRSKRSAAQAAEEAPEEAAAGPRRSKRGASSKASKPAAKAKNAKRSASKPKSAKAKKARRA